MYKSKVVKLYKTLSKKERKSLLKFANSPVFNQNEDVVQLVQYLNDLKDINEKNTDRAFLYRKVFKQKHYDESNLRHIASYLFKLIEEMIVFQSQQHTEQLKQIALIKYYRDKSLLNLLEGKIKKIENAEKTVPKSAEELLVNYNLLNEIALANEKIKRTNELNFEDILSELDKFYIAEKLKQTSNMLSHAAVFGQSFSYEYMELVFKYVDERKSVLENPAIAIHYYNYFMIKEPDNESHYDSYLNILLAHKAAFEVEELKNLFVLAINYNLRKANKGGKAYPQRVFDLYKLGLENKALLPYNKLSHVTYKNIINTALYLKENDWALKFIYAYKDHIDESIREDMFNYNLAHYYSRIDDYESAMRILATVDLKDDNYNARGKVLQLKTHYDSEEYDVAESLVDSFWIYLKRKDNLSYRKDLYVKFIKYMRMLMHIKPGDEERLVKIHHTVEQEQEVLEKKWLLEKIELRMKFV